MKMRIWSLFLLVIAVLFLTVTPVLAMQTTPPTDAGEIIKLAGLLFASLVNIPGFVTILINLLKWVKFLPDGYAPTFNLWANILIYAGVFVLVILGKTDVLAPIELAFAGINKVLLDLLILLGGSAVSMGLSGVYHGWLRKAQVPLFGYSYSAAPIPVKSKK